MLRLTYSGEAHGFKSYYYDYIQKGDHSILIRLKDEELVWFSCSCIYGSFHGVKKKGFEICRHILKAYAKTIKKSYKTAREILIKQGIMDPSHLEKP